MAASPNLAASSTGISCRVDPSLSNSSFANSFAAGPTDPVAVDGGRGGRVGRKVVGHLDQFLRREGTAGLRGRVAFDPRPDGGESGGDVGLHWPLLRDHRVRVREAEQHPEGGFGPRALVREHVPRIPEQSIAHELAIPLPQRLDLILPVGREHQHHVTVDVMAIRVDSRGNDERCG